VADPALGRGEYPATLLTPERNNPRSRHPLIHLKPNPRPPPEEIPVCPLFPYRDLMDVGWSGEIVAAVDGDQARMAAARLLGES